jgi:uncharacterized membrane protein YgcG
VSLFRGALRPPPIASDEAVQRYLESIRSRLEPDPAFRQRLRGEMLSRYIVARDAAESARRPLPTALRIVLRASLYATVAIGLSVGGVMAASQSAVPGDLLYSVKREIEELRVSFLPASFQDDLARWALAERISELGRLVESGDLDRASAMAGPIEAQVAHMTALGIAPSETDSALAGPLHVLADLVASLPPQAAAAIEDALASAPGLVRAAGGDTANDGGGNGGSGSGNGNTTGSGSGGGSSNGNSNDAGTGNGGGGSSSGGSSGGGGSGDNSNAGTGNNSGSGGDEPNPTDEAAPGVDDDPGNNGNPDPGQAPSAGNGGSGGGTENSTRTPKPKPSSAPSSAP